MSKEARFNLLFLIGLLAVSLPGVVLLIRKHLDPGARRLADPPYVRRTEAYNNPLSASSSSLRVMPAATAAWVESVSHTQVGASPIRHIAAGGRPEPIMSQGRRFELLAYREFAGGPELVVLAWLAEAGRGNIDRIDARGAGIGALEGVEIQRIQVPPQVIGELQDLGYVVPPAWVGVIWLRFSPLANTADTDRVGELKINWQSPNGEGEDVLDLTQVLPASLEAAKEVAGKGKD